MNNNILSIISGCAVCNGFFPPDPKPVPPKEEEDDRYVLDDGESGYPCNYCDPVKSPSCNLCIGS